jgi:hypothetical protein
MMLNVKTIMRTAIGPACVAAALLAPPAAHAGRSCEARPPTVQNVQRSLELAHRTHLALEASGAQVVLLARAGQDLSRYALRWSHVGWAYRLPAQGDRPVSWRVVHKLNACGSATGDLYRQGLAEFFLDDPFEYRAAFAIPQPATQQRLMALLQDTTAVRTAHEPAYSMLAYPWAQRYQQSNQWAIETLARAEVPTARSREQAQGWLRAMGFEPTVLRLGALTRLGARVTAANIAFDDHPNDKRFADRIETVGADSVFEWMQRAGLASAAHEVR